MQSLAILTGLAFTIKRISIEQSWQLFFELLILNGLCTLLILWFRKYRKNFFKNDSVRIGVILLALLAALNYVGLAILYPVFIDFADPAEANIAAVSWVFQKQQALYPALDATERYINNYGPFLYIINGFFLNLLKPSFFAVKIPGSLAGLGSLFLMFLTLKHRLKLRHAILGCGCISLSLLSLTSGTGLAASSFWVRPDSLLLFCTALGLFAVVRGNAIAATSVSAIALGISTNLKVTALLHFLPIYVVLYLRFGIFHTLISVLGSVVIAALPFWVFPQISFENYVAWLRQVSKKGLDVRQIWLNSLWILYVSIPIAIGVFYSLITNLQNFQRWIWRHRLYCCALFVGIAAGAVGGATHKALENNMLPFVPVLAYFGAELFRQITHSYQDPVTNKKRSSVIKSLGISIAFSFILSMITTVYSTEAGIISKIVDAPGYRAINDIHRFIAAHPKSSIAIGYGLTSYILSAYRPAPVFAGHPYLLDAASLMEMQASGMENTPASTLTALKNCQTQIWLIPKNEKPFQSFSYYAPPQRLFSPAFQKIFFDRYERKEQTEYYDAWVCKGG